MWTNSLEIAKSLKDKSKQLEAYVGLARALLKMDKVDKARKYLKRAYYLKAEPEEQDKVKQLLRIVTSIRADQHKLCIEQTSATRNLDQLIELCDRLGDNFVEVKCYAMAINYYQQELEFANEACKPDSVLAKIYVSLGQTYLDDEKYGEAIDHFEQETKLIARDPNNNLVEQAVSLMKIADCREAMLYSNELDEMEIERRAELRTDVVNTYRQALALFDIDRLESCWRRRRRNQSANDATSQIDEHWREELKTLMELLTNFKYFLATRGGCGGLESSLADELRHHLSKFNGFKVEEEEEETQTDDGDEVILIEGSANKNEFDLSSDSEAEPEVDDEIPDNFRSRPKRVAKSTTTHRLNQFGETPLHTACIAGNLAQVERLIEQGNAPLNARDNCGWTPLHEAANHGFLEIVECLIRAGADIEACDQRNERIRPLHDACQCGNFAVIRLLLKHNANVVAGNAQGETPVECLMAWRQRTPSDQLIGDDLAECIALENELMDRMKAKGFDLARLNRPTRLKGSATDGATKRYVMRRNLVDDLLYETENSQATAVVLDAPVDVDAPGYGRKEYKSAIAQLRGKKKKDIQLSEQKAALIEEDVVRDDWLIDDLKKTKKSKKRDLLDCEFDSGETKKKKSKSQSSSRSKNRGDEHDEDMHRELLEELQDLDDDFDTFDRSSPTRLTTTIEIVNDEDDFGDEDERHSHNSAESATSSKNNRQPLEAKLEAQKKEEPSVAIGGNQLVTVYFDDEHKSAFAVPVDNEQLDCRWLIEELTRRYFRRYSIKPNLSLVTRSSGAFLSEEDRILSVIDSSRSLMAKIVSWKIETADKRYIELCTTTASLTIDEDIEAMLKYANISATFRLTNMFVASSRQVEAMFQAMVRQTIKELDISFTNTLLQADCYLAFKTLLASLSSLEVLNLSGVGFPRAALVDLLNVSPVLRVLNLSYNSLGDEQCYTLAQMIKFCTKLEIIDLTGCDLTKSTVTNRLFIAAVQSMLLLLFRFPSSSFLKQTFLSHIQTLHSTR